MKTYSAKPGEIPRKWFVVDASQYRLGRLATEVAHRLRGKHKPEFTPHVDTGDYVIVVNAEQIRLTGKKRTDKTYYYHTGYPGGLKAVPFWKRHAEQPERIIEDAVAGMLPKNRLGRQMRKKLKVYRGSEHPHQAQQPAQLEL